MLHTLYHSWLSIKQGKVIQDDGKYVGYNSHVFCLFGCVLNKGPNKDCILYTGIAQKITHGI